MSPHTTFSTALYGLRTLGRSRRLGLSTMGLSRRDFFWSSRCSTAQKATPLADKLLTFNEKEGYIRHSPIEDITLPNVNLDQYIWQNLSKWPDHVATVCMNIIE